MSDLQIRKATRQGVRPIIDIYSESGGGKTYSALLLARGFVGPTGKMVVIDTEAGRAELYSDVAEFGGYDVLPLGEPFSPARYIDAMDIVEKSGAAIGVIDSGSHEWEGLGGVLDMADQNREESKKEGLHNWRRPKMAHALFLQKLLRSPIPWIVCLRAKYKTRQGKDDRGKTVIIKDDAMSAIQAEDFIYEATVHGFIDSKHNFFPTKTSHPVLATCLPTGSPITLEHGRLLAQWCANPGQAPTTSQSTKTQGGKPGSAILRELRTITEPIHHWNPSTSKPSEWEFAKGLLENWLIQESIIGDTEEISGLSPERLTEVLTKTKSALATAQPKELL